MNKMLHRRIDDMKKNDKMKTNEFIRQNDKQYFE